MDRWKVFYSGGKTAGGYRSNSHENGREEGVPTVEEFIKENLPMNGCLGCDGRTIHVAEGKDFETLVQEKEGRFEYQDDLAGEIWTDRPEMSKEPVYTLDVKYAGKIQRR